ncbi:MAG: hypothetical protein IPL49_05030 [Saprospirales bacterium]|nr:hypothetical protein [Saprospirales bacterium]
MNIQVCTMEGCVDAVINQITDPTIVCPEEDVGPIGVTTTLRPILPG